MTEREGARDAGYDDAGDCEQLVNSIRDTDTLLDPAMSRVVNTTFSLDVDRIGYEPRDVDCWAASFDATLLRGQFDAERVAATAGGRPTALDGTPARRRRRRRRCALGRNRHQRH